MRRLGYAIVCMALMVCVGGSVFAQAVSNVEVHGFMLNRFYANPDQSARFVTERISTIVQAKVGDDGQAYFEVYWHPWMTDRADLPGYDTKEYSAEWARTYVESAYVELPLGAGRLRVGKGRQLNFGLTPTGGNRKTTQYGILSETFTQDRIQGIQYYQKKGCLEGGLTLFSDQPVSARSIGDCAGATQLVKHIVDKDLPGEISGKLAVAGKFGVNTPKLQAHVSACVGKLDTDQLTTIANAFGPTTNTDHNKFGLDAIYNMGPMVAQGEYYWGDFSFVGVKGYSALLGYQPKDKMRFYARYAAINHDRSPIDWKKYGGVDVQQFTLGIVQPLRKGCWIELNWEKNKESGSPKTDNDLLFLELFTGF